MKNKLYLIFLLLTSLGFSQETSKGYYIDNEGKRFDVLFKRTDFYNQSSLKIKRETDVDFQKLDSQSIQEYGIGDDFKFVKKKVRHDKNFDQVAASKDYPLSEEFLFLNVLIEGEATLYANRSTGKNEYFYEVNGWTNNISRLVYKKYQLVQNGSIQIDNFFRNQLSDNLKCNSLQLNDFLNLKYDEKSLKNIFLKYNSCKDSKSSVYENKNGRKISFKYGIFVGIYQSSFSVDYGGKSEKEPVITFGAGAEMALVFPSQNQEIFARISYENYSGTSTRKSINSGNTLRNDDYTLDSGFINFNIGPRYYFSIAKKSRIYIDGSIAINIPSESNIKYKISYPNSPTSNESNTLFSTKSNANLNFGVGYSFDSKFAVDVRYDTARNIIAKENIAVSNFSRLGLNLKYTLN